VKRALYSFRDGSRFRQTQAQAVGEELERIAKKHGGKLDSLSPHIVLAEAKKPSSTLHAMFDWNDEAAAIKHRLHEARKLLGSIRVVYTSEPDMAPRNVFVSIKSMRGSDSESYVPMARVLNDSDLRHEAIMQALSEAESWQRRYEHLVELSQVFKAIDRERVKYERMAATA